MRNRSEHRLSGQIMIGLALVIFGLLALLDNFGYIDIGPVWQFWPLIFVVIGLNKILNSRSAKVRGEGIWWIFFGLWLFVSISHLFGLHFGNTWPMLLIAWGFHMLWKSHVQESKFRITKEDSYAR